MLPPLFDISTLKDQLAAGALILTSNHRLANKIREAWGRERQDTGHRVWPQPRVHSLDNWLAESWQNLCDSGDSATLAGAVIDPHQERLLWERVIEEDEIRPPQLQPGSCAIHAQQAMAISQQYLIPDSLLSTSAQLFDRWRTAFRARLHQLNLITETDRLRLVVEACQRGAVTRERELILVGFQTLSPLVKALFGALSERQTSWQPAARENHICRVTAHTAQLELEAAARWVRDLLEKGGPHRIGIVVPDLARLRPVAERVFREVLEPGYPLPDRPRKVQSFNISAGEPLADTPLVDTALQLLALNGQRLPLEHFTGLLNSPFWGAGLSLSATVDIELRLRNLGQLYPTTGEFRRQFQVPDEPPASEQIFPRLELSERKRRQMPARNFPSQWAALFIEQLELLNWPGPRPLDSLEYQQLQSWQSVLEKFTALDCMRESLDLNSALYQLRQVAAATVFHGETADSPVQILGVLESAGLSFSHLWITGMNDRGWPPETRPNPLLPIHLQRQYRTPRSTPEGELELAREQLSLLKASAGLVVLSHAEADGDLQLQPSPLIVDFPESQLEELIPEYPQSPEPAFADLETVTTAKAPPLLQTGETIRGGAGILATQAVCPFNAFAVYRLGAEALPEPGLGMNARERGVLVHTCLDHLWQRLQSRDALLALDDGATGQLIDEVVESALARLSRHRPDLFTPVFHELEKDRLCRLLGEWLNLERTRGPFEVVAQESGRTAELAGLPLSLRVDRIDRLADGSLVIIDYKTGKPGLSGWLGERPEQPQLPLYAAISEQAVAAISYGIVTVGNIGFLGIGREKDLLPNLVEAGGKNSAPDWDQQLEQWRANVTALAREFADGEAAVACYHRSAFQWQSALLPLNRWPEAWQ